MDSYIFLIFLIPFAKITKPFPKVSGCAAKRHRTAQTIKLKAEIQLYMPECKLRLKAVRAYSTDQHDYFGGFIPKHTELSQSIIFSRRQPAHILSSICNQS